MGSTTIANERQIGRDVPDEIAFPLMIKRMKSKVTVTESGCWEHPYANPTTGYVQLFFRGKRWSAHRLMHTLAKGPLPKGKDCCHTCDNRCCVNPDHLWIGTRQQNLLDASAKGRVHCQKKTHCPKGHAYAEHGVRHGKPQWRKCTICCRARLRIAAGWPKDLAYSMPPQGHGYRPIKANWTRVR